MWDAALSYYRRLCAVIMLDTIWICDLHAVYINLSCRKTDWYRPISLFMHCIWNFSKCIIIVLNTMFSSGSRWGRTRRPQHPPNGRGPMICVCLKCFISNLPLFFFGLPSPFLYSLYIIYICRFSKFKFVSPSL